MTAFAPFRHFVTTVLKLGALTGALLASTTAAIEAQDSAFAWENATEFSFVTTSGNTSSNTLGLKSTLSGGKRCKQVQDGDRWNPSVFKFHRSFGDRGGS